MAKLADLGVFGLSTMGANLARNAARKGFGVAVYNRHGARTDELIADHGSEGRFAPAKTITDFVAALAKPRPIIIMIKAGKPVDDVIDELVPHLEDGDIVIDGGNSLFTDTSRRFHALAAKNLRFVGMGVSGGEEGALEGPSMMPGGDREAYQRIAPIVTKMAAQVDGEPCCAFIGPEGCSGHYVKMVHNGIEYADMQLIAEAYDLFKSVSRLRTRRRSRACSRNGRPANSIPASRSRSPPPCCASATPRAAPWSTPSLTRRSRKAPVAGLPNSALDPRRAADLDRWKRSTPARSRRAARSAPPRRDSFSNAPLLPRNPGTGAKSTPSKTRCTPSKIVAYAQQGFEQMTAAAEYSSAGA